MLRNNQISLIVLLIIIGVTLYLISCDKNESPIKFNLSGFTGCNINLIDFETPPSLKVTFPD